MTSGHVGDLLESALWASLECSHDSDFLNSHLVVVLVGQGTVFVSPGSDRSGSAIEDEPLVLVSWLVELESESVLLMANVLLHDDRPLGSHLRSNLESLSVIKWLLRSHCTVLVNSPFHVGWTVVAGVEADMGSPVCSVGVHAVSGIVLDVLGRTIVPSDLVLVETSVLSDHSVSTVSHSMSAVNTDGMSLFSI